METVTYPFQQIELQLNERVQDLLSRLTLAEKVSLMPQYQAAIERLGVGGYKHGTEGAHGISWLGKATSYPQPSGLACTWNPELLQRIGSAIGDEARAFYKKNPAVNGLTLWAPTVDMERDPRWGRTEEAYGEDPELTGQLSTALVKGIQGDHPVYLKAVATLKHFLGNNNEIDRGVASSSIDPRNMREYYLEAFKPAFKEGGAQSMMTAYNSVNGVPVILHPAVMEIVKGEWEMDGFIVSDAGDLFGIVKDHKYYDSFARSMAESIKNGIDSVTEETEETIKVIHEALQQGLLTEGDLDRALSNTFRIRFRLGEFDPAEGNPYAGIDDSVILSKAHGDLSLQAAKESIVLLKNEKAALPLNADKLSRVAVIGPLGDEAFRDWYSGTLPYAVTPLQGVTKKLAGKQVAFESGSDRIILTSAASGRAVGITGEDGRLAVLHDKPEHGELFRHTAWGWTANTLEAVSRGQYVTLTDAGTLTASADEIYGWYVKESLNLVPEAEGAVSLRTWNDQPVVISPEDGTLRAVQATDEGERLFHKNIIVDGIAAAVRAAKDAEVAVVFVGNHPLLNGKEEIDRPDIVLPEEQEQLVKAVYAANPNTVVVIVGSYPISSAWIDEHIPAVLYTSHSGQELGNAVADVLFGDYSPSGRLNMTWYRSVDQLPEFMDYDIIKGKRTYMYFDGEPLYPFGHGLSYAQVVYSRLSLAAEEVQQAGTISLSVELANSSSTDTDEVVQVYVQSLSKRIRRPLKQLKDFAKIRLAAGQSQIVSFELPASDLAFWDVSREQYCVEDGEYNILVGRSSGDIRLSAKIRVHGDTVPARSLYTAVKAENYDDYEAVFLDECKAGGASVHPVKDGAWIAFNNVEFAEGAAGIEALVSSVKGGSIEVRTGSPAGEPAATLEVPAGTAQEWHSHSAAAALAAGTADVYLVFTGDVLLSRVQFTV
ncbi:glycoside hydrolase family 3 C-terminal domain-containing protein [Paenibacillus sp. MMS20-IR301]|uniref:glycoside hydrolase family 3 protein n=1 Tax=Paenibacillus sp. MMS20-IR301 TaxID=2895946 RepID=UPI0028E72486|nr:glycoside hydrolase family 3 C-terminal domain-containing protein [Paenibacillus sp. MMS20-IR301]WNS46786.1 glycoside hydrolase family 3 C-terminal domain-containing protein [Paenibacillus sp. MMS20-IR301]